jgi:hypothetical protein
MILIISNSNSRRCALKNWGRNSFSTSAQATEKSLEQRFLNQHMKYIATGIRKRAETCAH